MEILTRFAKALEDFWFEWLAPRLMMGLIIVGAILFAIIDEITSWFEWLLLPGDD